MTKINAAVRFTGATWWDTVIALAIAAFVAVRAVILGREVLAVLGQHAPAEVEPREMLAALMELDSVEDVHDLHVWAMSTTQTALTVHIVRPDGASDAVTQNICRALHDQFGISHVTVQIERAAEDYCPSH